MPSQTPRSMPPDNETLARKWPKDIAILSFLAGSLWAITIFWMVSGGGQWLEQPIHSESGAWLFALSGAALVYLLVAGIVMSWGVILGVPTCLLLICLCLSRFGAKRRLILASLITTAIFIGIPIVLNHQEEKRLAAIYGNQDGALPSRAGRAIELRSSTPRIGDFPIRCDGDCLDLMTFGRASSVTRTFPKATGQANTEAAFQNFHLGVGGPDCAGPTFKNFCAHATSESIPDDRLILTLETVKPLHEDEHRIYVRRLSVRDTSSTARNVATSTRLVFARYSGLLNIAWGENGLYLRREGIPIATSSLDVSLYRSFISNRSLNGRYYPFR